jgi:uncharacterized protein (DUF488 family)
MPGQMRQVLSIGHSTLDYEQFVARLKAAGITAVADVRTSPFSRNFPQYNRETLKEALAQDDIAYVFLGKELGGRPKGREYYTDGIADYEKMATADTFRAGLDRIEQGVRKYRIAIMCSELNPLDCHRCLLVGRALAGRGLTIGHILSDGQIVRQEGIERQLLVMAGKQEDDMFASPAERVNDAYRDRARKVAFAESQLVPNSLPAE